MKFIFHFRKKMFPKACHFAAEKHKNQRRKCKAKTPYINHPLEVAFFISEIEAKQKIGEMPKNWFYIDMFYDLLDGYLCVAVLHDVLEDTDATYEELQKEFGELIAHYVLGCTDNKSLPKLERKKRQVEKVRDGCIAVKMVKMADKLSNVSDLLSGNEPEGWTQEMIEGYIIWSLAVCREAKEVAPKMYAELCKRIQESGKVSFDPYTITEEEFEARLQAYYKTLEKPPLSEDIKNDICKSFSKTDSLMCNCGATAHCECPYCEEVCIPHGIECTGHMCYFCMCKDSAPEPS